ncbi:peptidylprolyl isomerase [Parvibaculum sp.]|uniref:peptidylprolyl isomerase n=1 Tax=Parvibaculum sp. TaxID=2024848 RepID=UPI002BAD0D0D|nr:peptidylprolyl isomerase [Parvibaculum sp.]HUD50808.1 peptidylprolyl isomerase [Parvibaculum sp.]
MKPSKLACSLAPAVIVACRVLSAFAFVSLVGLAGISPGRAADSLGAPSPDSLGLSTDEPSATSAGDTQGIVAIVNDHIISRYDLNQRVKLVMVTSGIPNSPEMIDRIQKQVLRSLIDEALEVEEAKRLDLKVEQREIDQQLAQIAARANMTPAQIDDYLKENGVSKDALISQLYADIAWNKVIGQQYAPLVTVGDDEIDETLKRIEAEADQPRYLVSEILLTFDNPQQEAEVMAGAQRLVDQMRQGAPFAAVARQFSQSASSANGGDIGWEHASQMPAEIVPVVQQMTIGGISDPIRTLNGVYIIQVRNKQTGLGPDPLQDRWTLAHVLLPLTPDAPDALVARRAAEAQKFISEFKSCDAIADQVKQFVGGMAQAPRTVVFGQLDQRLREGLSKAKPGDVLKPVRSQQGIEMIAVCGYQADSGGAPTRDQIENSIYSQRLDMMARRHLRDLRRDAVVDIR